MASGPIISWQIKGRKVDAMTDFIFLGSRITMGSDCSHQIKTHLFLCKSSYEKSKQHIKKQRHHFADKVHKVKAMVFPVVMYGYESLAIKKAECRRIDIF